MPQLSLTTPLGAMTLTEDAGALTVFTWSEGAIATEANDDTPLLRAAAAQLAAYFAGRLTRFELPLAPGGSAFQLRVYDAMQAIPYGRTRTYGELAAELGTAARAIGNACGANPLPILIPCHRVVAAGGRLGGYSGGRGPASKRVLLALEDAVGLDQPARTLL
jgi:methylated-DNA-[protein]-cysteine S-methyltransferase